MKKPLFFLMLAIGLFKANAQSDKAYQNEDNRQRGYYDHPYLRYEAEEEKVNSTNGTFIFANDYDQRKLASEASNQRALQLINQNSYVSWKNERAADGLNIRFSLPDNAQGTGISGTLALYVDDIYVQDITLNSYWAWQWQRIGGNHADNTPDANFPDGNFSKYARMRFDETHVKLANEIPANAVFKLVKKDNNATPYTIDFVELEKVPAPVLFEDIADVNKVTYEPSGDKTLSDFINSNDNLGKTIYIPAGKYTVKNTILITSSNVKIIGAGMWYTEIYFDVSTDNINFERHGISIPDTGDKTCVAISGMYLNNNNRKRLRDINDENSGTGKGLHVMCDNNAVVRDVWIEHFECGSWIEKANGMHILYCRFRNNYADGINLCRGTKNTIVEHCSFRNNGDDDMATWSRYNTMCINNTFRYNTAENNWRASSLGFFGGQHNSAHHCLITDGLDAGFRVTAEFEGAPFSNVCYSIMHDISVYRGGAIPGARGVSGDYYGREQGALHLYSSSNYDIKNFRIYNIDLYQSKNDAVYINSGGGKKFLDVGLANVNIHGAARYGIRFSNARGDIAYCSLTFENCASENIFNLPSTNFIWTEVTNCNDLTAETTCNGLPVAPDNECSSTVDVVVLPQNSDFAAYSENGQLIIKGMNLHSVTIFDAIGRIVNKSPKGLSEFFTSGLSQGVYVVCLDNTDQILKVVVK